MQASNHAQPHKHVAGNFPPTKRPTHRLRHRLCQHKVTPPMVAFENHQQVEGIGAVSHHPVYGAVGYNDSLTAADEVPTLCLILPS